MNVYKISFLKKTEIIINEETLEPVWDYLGCLYKNGQILRNYELVHDLHGLFAYATLPDDDALNGENNNIYVNKYRDEVLKNFEIMLEIVGKNMNKDDSCACENSSWYMLYTDYSLLESPVVCGDCGKTVPLYRLPHIHDHEHFGVVGWQQAYKSIDNLWLHCLADRFTLRQLHDPNAQLSQEGREICKAFEEKTGKPFYYYLFQNRRTNKQCPICYNDWTVEEAGDCIDYKCERCRVVAEKV